MKFIDQDGNEILESAIDYSKGRVIGDKLFVAHHDAVEAVDEVNHYEVKKIYFTDGTSLDVESNEDSHIKILSEETGVFDYVDQGEGKTMRGMDIRQVTDTAKTEAKDAYDEYEDVNRYILYTEDELKEREEAETKAEKQQEFLNNGPDLLDSTATSVEDLTVILSELVGSSE